jgi:hypothetical protein
MQKQVDISFLNTTLRAWKNSLDIMRPVQLKALLFYFTFKALAHFFSFVIQAYFLCTLGIILGIMISRHVGSVPFFPMLTLRISRLATISRS